MTSKITKSLILSIAVATLLWADSSYAEDDYSFVGRYEGFDEEKQQTCQLDIAAHFKTKGLSLWVDVEDRNFTVTLGMEAASVSYSKYFVYSWMYLLYKKESKAKFDFDNNPFQLQFSEGCPAYYVANIEGVAINCENLTRVDYLTAENPDEDPIEESKCKAKNQAL